jgi:hypothetical protein
MRGLRQLFALVRARRAARDPLGLGLVLALAGYGALALALPFWPALARFEVARFHLDARPFALWACLQPYPWMYNFENWVLVSPTPLGALAEAPLGSLPWRAINHQSARAFTWFEGRGAHLTGTGTRYLYMRTRYRDQLALRCLRADVLEPAGDEAQPATLRPCEEAP